MSKLQQRICLKTLDVRAEFRGSLLMLCMLFFPALLVAQDRPPNIIVVMYDDLGSNDLGVYGSPFISTPTIDALAAEGRRFTSYYAQSTCSPTRAGMMTGRHPQRFNIRRPLPGQTGRGLYETAPTLAETLREAGYATGTFGKWHLGTKRADFLPAAKGFDEYAILAPLPNYENAIVFTHELGFWAPWIAEDPDKLGRERTVGLSPEVFTDVSIDFLRRRADQPFYLRLTYRAPHPPLDDPDLGTPPQELIDHYAAACRDLSNPSGCQGQKYAAAMVTFLDQQMEKLVAALDDLDLAENTYLFVLGDNGGPYRHFLQSTAPYNGMKDTLYEGGIRAPMIVRGPEIDPGVTGAAMTHLDLFPTIAELTGVDVEGLDLEGLSFADFLTVPGTEQPSRALFWESKTFAEEREDSDRVDDWAVRRGVWKLMVGSPLFLDGNRLKPDLGVVETQLYNLREDPGETVNLVAERPVLVEQLRALYRDWRADVSGLDCPTTEIRGRVERDGADWVFVRRGKVEMECAESDVHDGDFSMSLRVSPDEIGETAVIATKLSNGSNEPIWTLSLLDDGRIELTVRSDDPDAGSLILRSTATLEAGSSTHLAWTVQGRRWQYGSVVRLYVDGELQDRSEGFAHLARSDQAIRLGRRASAPADFFVGRIEDLTWALTQWDGAEIEAAASSGD